MNQPSLFDVDAEIEREREELAKERARDALCDAGHHAADPMYNWRCDHCRSLLCATCGHDLDGCGCGGGAR